MKKYILLLLLFFAFCFGVKAQQTRFIFPNEKDSIAKDASEKIAPELDDDSIPSYSWTISPHLGETYRTELNLLGGKLVNFHQTSLVDGQDVSVGYLGNLGSPAQSKIFFSRGEGFAFDFSNAFRYYYKQPEDQVFRNTKQPYSNIYYQSGGGGASKEERFLGEISINFGKKLNVGMNFDYLYARGFYSNLYNKQINYNFYMSYIGSKYQLHAFAGNNNYTNSENGGLKYDSVLSVRPEIPNLEMGVRMQNTWNALRGRHIYATGKYNIGDDSDTTKTFIPAASLIFTTNYADQRRRFVTYDDKVVNNIDKQTNLDLLYDYKTTEHPMYMYPADDRTSFWSFRNTFAITMNEGFREWVKFGLTAFIEQNTEQYSLPYEALPKLHEVVTENTTIIGGALYKEKGRFLKYNLLADIAVAGVDMGEFRLKADVSTMIPFAGKSAILQANAYIKNLRPTMYQERFFSKYYQWNATLNNIKHVFVGGQLTIPHTNTRISGGVENINNLVYYGADKLVAQESSNIQIASLRLDQNLKAGIFHWDNQLVYQTSSNQNALPLPALSAYTNIYLLTKLTKVLTLQLGVDAHFNTKYYAPGYEPVTLQFYNQRNVQIGGFPISTAYANLDLKNTRFFIMMYNVAKSAANDAYFTVPNYPLNPMILKFGISWDFND